MELVNNAFNFDVEKWTIAINDAPVMMIGTFKKPWISGKELCDALGYQNSQKALFTHVKSKHKKTLMDLLQEKKVHPPGGVHLFLAFR